MRRRDFLIGSAAAAWSLAARAQQSDRTRRIGWLVGLPEQDAEARRRNAALVDALQGLGWTPGRNLQIDYLYAAGDDQNFERQAAELISLAPDVLLANSTPSTRALQLRTGIIPIVFAVVVDPVNSGLVTNFARPGGNVTGFTSFEAGMSAKWIEFLKTLSPGITKVALIFNPHTAPYEVILPSIEATVPGFGIQITTRGIADVTALEAALATAERDGGTALIVFPDLFTTTHKEQIIKLAMQHRLPAVYPFRHMVTAGGLISYGPDTVDQFRRVAGYIDRLLKGEKPGGLPIQAPTKFELAINLKTAKALDLTVPPSLLATADEVIE
jgi:putative ABC transport system substrate-binding protein